MSKFKSKSKEFIYCYVLMSSGQSAVLLVNRGRLNIEHQGSVCIKQYTKNCQIQAEAEEYSRLAASKVPALPSGGQVVSSIPIDWQLHRHLPKQAKPKHHGSAGTQTLGGDCLRFFSESERLLTRRRFSISKQRQMRGSLETNPTQIASVESSELGVSRQFPTAVASQRVSASDVVLCVFQDGHFRYVSPDKLCAFQLQNQNREDCNLRFNFHLS